MNRIELLAPAGDLERLKTAIIYGADAVYIGGKQFSLRSRASNFSLSQIKEAVEFAAEYNAKIHVTVNMIPHEEDLEGLEAYIRQLDEIGVSAVICASVSIIQTVKKISKRLEVHLSTQQSALNYKAVEYYRDLEVDRVVLGRELNMMQIKNLSELTVLPLEVFIHGGMCSNYSGRCTLSNYMTFRDANRGGCAHSCRWKYHLYHQGEEISSQDCLFSMSSRDLMAAVYLPALIESGISSLKIEGRMKSFYYIAIIVSAYRRLIDAYYDKEYLSESDYEEFYRELKLAENRPTATGFLAGLPDNTSHLYGVNGAGVTHDFLGKVLDYQNGKALLEVRNYFQRGDTVEIFSSDQKPRRIVIETITDQDGEVLEVCNKPMQQVYITLPFGVREYDIMRKAYD